MKNILEIKCVKDVVRLMLAFLIVTAGSLNSGVLYAHAKGENYVWLNVEDDYIDGRFEVRQNDLKNKLEVDIETVGDSAIEGVLASQSVVQKYLLDHFSISDANGEMTLEFADAALVEDNEIFVQYPFRINTLPVQNEITIQNRIFLTPDMIAKDRLHRSLLVVEYNKVADKEFGAENVALVFSPKKSELMVDLDNLPTVLVWQDFLWQGFLHILIGLDHIVFIVLILLTVVLRREDSQWTHESGFTAVLWNALKVITTFTVAHSVTLSLAALGYVTLNTTIIETIIAVSILVLAITNVFPIRGVHGLALIFIFGLFHGLGFASVMGDLQFRTVLIERILVLFNVGVELGQILIALLVLPVLFLLRKNMAYRKFVVWPVSIAAGCLAILWITERSGVFV